MIGPLLNKLRGVLFTVLYRQYFQDFDNWLLNRGWPFNRWPLIGVQLYSQIKIGTGEAVNTIEAVNCLQNSKTPVRGVRSEPIPYTTYSCRPLNALVAKTKMIWNE